MHYAKSKTPRVISVIPLNRPFEKDKIIVTRRAEQRLLASRDAEGLRTKGQEGSFWNGCSILSPAGYLTSHSPNSSPCTPKSHSLYTVCKLYFNKADPVKDTKNVI